MRARPIGHHLFTRSFALSPATRQGDKRNERTEAAHDDLHRRTQDRACHHACHLLEHLTRQCNDNRHPKRNSTRQGKVKRCNDPQVADPENERDNRAKNDRGNKRLMKRNGESSSAEAHEQRQVRPHPTPEAVEHPRRRQEENRDRNTPRMIGVPRHFKRRVRRGRLKKYPTVSDEVYPDAHAHQAHERSDRPLARRRSHPLNSFSHKSHSPSPTCHAPSPLKPLRTIDVSVSPYIIRFGR